MMSIMHDDYVRHSGGGARPKNRKPEARRILSGVDIIAMERRRQVTKEGWTPEHDDAHTEGQLVAAAMCYAHVAFLQVERGNDNEGAYLVPPDFVVNTWPFDWSWWKPVEGPLRNLEKAGALIAAEYDRICRAEQYDRICGVEKQAAPSSIGDFPRLPVVTGGCSVVREWVSRLSYKQQTVLLVSFRGVDGAEKQDMSKNLCKALRETLLHNAAPESSTFMQFSVTEDYVLKFVENIDHYPVHWLLHFMHAAEIVGYKHPEPVVRRWWHNFYLLLVDAMHLRPETEADMDTRLKDDLKK